MKSRRRLPCCCCSSGSLFELVKKTCAEAFSVYTVHMVQTLDYNREQANKTSYFIGNCINLCYSFITHFYAIEMFFALITTVLRFVLLQFILLAMSNMRARNYDKTKLTTERGFYCLRRLRCVDTNGLIRIVYYWLLNGDHFMSNDKSIGC